MAVTPVDELLLREPNLWVPGKKPVGNVKIDHSHPMAKDLLTFQIPSEKYNRELVSNKQSVLHTNGSYGVDATDPYLESTSDTTGGSYTSFDKPVIPDVGYAFTVLVFCQISSLAQYGEIVSFPWKETTWTDPYSNFNLSRDNELDILRVQGIDFKDQISPSSTFSYVSTSPIMIGCTCASGTSTPEWYRYEKGEPPIIHGAARQALGTRFWDTFDTGIGLLQRNVPAYQGEGGTGKIWWSAFWFRKLSTTEVESMYNDPYQFLIPA